MIAAYQYICTDTLQSLVWGQWENGASLREGLGFECRRHTRNWERAEPALEGRQKRFASSQALRAASGAASGARSFSGSAWSSDAMQAEGLPHRAGRMMQAFSLRDSRRSNPGAAPDKSGLPWASIDAFRESKRASFPGTAASPPPRAGYQAPSQDGGCESSWSLMTWTAAGRSRSLRHDKRNRSKGLLIPAPFGFPKGIRPHCVQLA